MHHARRTNRTTAMCLVVACLATLAAWLVPSTVGSADAAAPAGAAARQGGTLEISPKVFYGGQGITYRGTVAHRGKTRVWIEGNMNREGDEWSRIPGSGGWTDAQGRFVLRFPARGMFRMSTRVASKYGATPGQLMEAVDQEIALGVEGGTTVDAFRRYSVETGASYTVVVDTTQSNGPVLAGRDVSLQRRDGTTWRTVATSALGNAGKAQFTLTAGQPGQVVYRARLGRWSKNGSRMGWVPGFPTFVDVREVGARVPAPRVATRTATSSDSPARAGIKAPSASERWDWRPALFDFAWEYGEALTDRPMRGTDRRGEWIDTSTGSGRAARQNGGMMLESKYTLRVAGVEGPGDFGTTTIRLRGNARTYGRWEVILRSGVLSGDAGEGYDVEFALVPADPADRACGARRILGASYTPGTDEVRFGAFTPTGNRAWRGTKHNVTTVSTPHAFAVEIGRDHITWFVDSVPVGTVTNTAAIPKVPMTMEIGLVGDGMREMKHTFAIVDWMRGFDLERGQQVRSGGAMNAGTHTEGC